MKKLMAMALAGTLALSSTVLVFANDPVVSAPVAETTAAEVVAAPVEEVKEIVNIAFTGVEKEFVNSHGVIVGKYLHFNKNSDLSTKIVNLVNDTYQTLQIVHGTITYSTDVDYIVDYRTEECLTAAKIEIYAYDINNLTSVLEQKTIATYYVDKANEATITADAYEARKAEEAAGAVAPVEEVPGETPAIEEIVMLPLRAYAESLGYEVSWDNGKVTVSKDGAVVSLETGSPVYVNAAGEEVTLDAPENIDGTLYVPHTFFTEVLGVEVVIETEAPAEVAPVEEVPAEAAPVEAAPAEGAPADDAAPVEPAPVA